MSLFTSFAFTLATWLLMLVPLLVFAASWTIWKLRGARNIVRDFALYDGVAGFIVTVCLVIALLPYALAPNNLAFKLFAIFPTIYAIMAYRHYDKGRRFAKVISTFQVLREERQLRNQTIDSAATDQ